MKDYTYKIFDTQDEAGAGYDIFINGRLIYRQREPHILFPELDYEGNAQKHIEILKAEDVEKERSHEAEKNKESIESEMKRLKDSIVQLTELVMADE